MVRRVWLEQAGAGLSLEEHNLVALPFISPKCGQMFCLVSKWSSEPEDGLGQKVSLVQ